MVPCSRCGYQQKATLLYCKRCGLSFPSLAIYEPIAPEYKIVSRVMICEKPIQRISTRVTARMLLNRVVREGIAGVGLFIAGFGLFGLFQDVFGANWALFLGLFVVMSGIIAISVLFFKGKHLFRLRWPQIVVGEIGATIFCSLVLISISGIVQEGTLSRDVGFGLIVFLYGLCVAGLVVL